MSLPTRKQGRQALPTPATLTKVRDWQSIARAPKAQARGAAADALVGRAIRALRRIVELRLNDATPTKCLAQLNEADDAMSSARWVLQYEAAMAKRGES